MRFSSAGASPWNLSAPQPTGLIAQAGDDQEAGRPRELVCVSRDAEGRIEAGIESRVEFCEVLFEAPPGVGRVRILDREPNHRCLQELLDLRPSRPRAPRAAGRSAAPGSAAASWSDRRSSSARSAIPFAVREARRTLRSVRLTRTRTSPARVERPQDAADAAGIEAEPAPERAQLRSVTSDLPEQPGLTDRPAPAKESVVEHADALR